MTHVIRVKEDFSPKPYGRLPKHDREANGELFRQSVLLPALQTHEHVTIDFTGITTVGGSFLDEAIAGLIYHEGFTEAQVRQRIDLVIPSDPTKKATAWKYVALAEASRLASTIRKRPARQRELRVAHA